MDYYPMDILDLVNSFVYNNSKLFDVNRQLRQTKLKYYMLNRHFSLEYYRNPTFRETVHERILSPRLQLSLNFTNISISDVTSLGGVHTLNLSGTAVRDVSPLQNVPRLNLSFCRYLTDVSSLKNVQYLGISFTDVSDVSELGHLRFLDISWCTNISDISALTNVCIQGKECVLAPIPIN